MEGGGCVGADLKRKTEDWLASGPPQGTRRTYRAFPALPGATPSLIACGLEHDSTRCPYQHRFYLEARENLALLVMALRFVARYALAP